MATTTTTRPAKKSAGSSRSRGTTGRTSARVRGGDHDAARDAVMRAAEEARQDVIRSEQAQDGIKMIDGSDLKHLVKDMPDEYVQCRAFGHGRALANYAESRGIKSFTLYCPTCKFRRDLVIKSRTGEILEDKPDWPEGYLLPKGSGRIGSGTKGVVRLETLSRLVTGTTTNTTRKRSRT